MMAFPTPYDTSHTSNSYSDNDGRSTTTSTAHRQIIHVSPRWVMSAWYDEEFARKLEKAALEKRARARQSLVIASKLNPPMRPSQVIDRRAVMGYLPRDSCV